ncbi:hypothetical protein ACNKHK_00265 [Shigella flexneri]
MGNLQLPFCGLRLFLLCAQDGRHPSQLPLVRLVGEKHAKGLFGTIVDNFSLVALIFAISTSLVWRRRW